jgi:hypothetical protein
MLMALLLRCPFGERPTKPTVIALGAVTLL